MESSYFWTNIAFLAAGTLAIRLSMIAAASKIQISDRTKEIFSFIPAAILPAFIAPAVYFHQGHIEWMAGKERLVVMILALAVSYYTRSTLATITFGLGALYLLA